MRGNKTLTEGLINTREFINGVNNSSRDYYEKTIRFFGGGGVIITLTSLIKLYVTDIDTNETVLFTTIETSPVDEYNWGWDLRDALLDLEVILSRGNWRKELKFEDSLSEDTSNEQTINENEREPGREYFEDLINEMIEVNWGPSVDGYWTNKIKNASMRDLRKEKLNLDADGKGKVYVDTTRNEVNDYLEVIADAVLNVRDKYNSIPKVNKTKKSWRAADERKAGLRENQEVNNQLKWLLNLPEGYLAAISACVGTDCSLTDTMEHMLRAEFDYIKVIGKWDGIEETSFLVFTENENMAKALVQTGIYDFNQEDVYVWKTPMTMADITEGTNEGTRLDDKYYYFDLDKIIMKRDNVIMEKILNENTGVEHTIDKRIKIVFNYVYNDDENSYNYGDSFLYDINLWKEDEDMAFERPMYGSYNEMLNGTDTEIEEALEEELRKAFPELEIHSVDLVGDIYDMRAYVHYLDPYHDSSHFGVHSEQIDIELVEVSDKAWDEADRRVFWADDNNLNESVLKENTAGLDFQDIAAAVEDAAGWVGEVQVDNAGEVIQILIAERDDQLDPKDVNKILSSENTWDAFYDLVADIEDNSWDWLHNNKEEVIRSVMEEYPELDEDFLLDRLYVNYDAEKLLDQEYPMFFNVNTGDGNYDYTLNPNNSMDEEEIKDLSNEASVVWLAGTQGYSREDVVGAILDGDYKGSKFLKSLIQEYIDTLSHMNSIIFLGTMSLKDMMDSKETGSIKVPTNTVLGFWDGWSGSGSTIGIELEKPVVVPYELRDRIYTAYGKTNDVYTPQEIYGLISEVYNADFILEAGLRENTKTLNETEEVYYTGAIYDIENIAQDFEEDEEVVRLNGLIDLRDSGLMVLYSPRDRDIIATGTKEQFKEFIKTNKYMSEYDWHAFGGGGAMVDELIAMEALWVDDNVEVAKRFSTNLDNEIKKLLSDLK